MVLAFLALFFLNTWQGFRYQELEREVEKLELEQKNWLEQNKKAIAALAALSSPQRVKTLAVERLGLRPLKAQEVIEIELEGGQLD
ncbi:MAG: hypothetical protein JXB06_08865 [Spirochaetales bacterium]|nr:hypothetical protein [Spirochaetales bacterium]